MSHYLVHISDTKVACAYCGKTEGLCLPKPWTWFWSWFIGKPLSTYTGSGDDLPEPW